MTRGRKPKATAVKEASGSYKKDPQRRNHDEPKPLASEPAMPDAVRQDKVASSKWKEICSLLGDMKVLTIAEQDVLTLYCITYSEWCFYREHILKHGITSLTAQGTVTTSPQAHQYNKLSDRLLKMFPELGLTPSSRSRIKAHDATPEENPIAALLSRFESMN